MEHVLDAFVQTFKAIFAYGAVVLFFLLLVRIFAGLGNNHKPPMEK